ncbi:Hypothetical Protein FCC1311_011682 [Hondaea fermentalgiana]|uniref:Uncharacterized protein n=1 Tax=Hondaea fermentalgiana TaxID=2315210 RepID=A0A2R5GA25_9STRA|nr:Hypothetical Protein FCC1311_011682 [Hondaea fermentalgiana]|eukprot:GBG24951.1 Hypothetical Protein FCC1311_011682 [Hondaea fermentalgiana]
MAQSSELHWSRWRHEESTRTFQGHVTRLKAGIRPHVPVSSRKEPSYRTRYVQHRTAARELRRRALQRRIDAENYALGKKIAHVEPAVDTLAPRRPKGARNKSARAEHAAIQQKELFVSNVAFLRRIVAAKPFITKEGLEDDCRRMQVYLERLRRVREERLSIIQRRMDICKEVAAVHKAKMRALKQRDATLRRTRREEQQNVSRTRVSKRVETEMGLLQRTVDQSFKRRPTASMRASMRQPPLAHVTHGVATLFVAQTVKTAVSGVVSRKVSELIPWSPGAKKIAIKVRKPSETARVMDQKAQVLAQLRTTLQPGLTVYLEN